MTVSVPRLVERFPSERVIRWNPLPDSYHLLAEMIRGPEDEYKLVVAQAALRQIDAHLHDSASATAVGFLLGQLYECPETGLHYTLVRGIERVPEAYVEVEDGALTEETWRALDPELRRLGAHVVGWYRSRPRVTAQMPPLDAQAHITRFRQPWQAALLVSPDVERPSGAFFQYEARVGRVYAVPFHELLDSHPVHGTAGQRTWVRWVNYVTDTDLGLLLNETRRVAEEARSEGAQSGRMLQPLRDALDDAWSWVRAQRRPEAPPASQAPARPGARPTPVRPSGPVMPRIPTPPRTAPAVAPQARTPGMPPSPAHGPSRAVPHAPHATPSSPPPPRIVPRTAEPQRPVPLRPAALGGDLRGPAPQSPRLTTPPAHPAVPMAPAASAAQPVQPPSTPRPAPAVSPMMGAAGGAAQAAARARPEPVPPPAVPPAAAPPPVQPPARTAWVDEGAALPWPAVDDGAGGVHDAHAGVHARLAGEHAEPVPQQDLNAPLAVVLPPGFYRPSRLTGRRVLALGGAGVLAAAALTVFLMQGSAPDPRRVAPDAGGPAPAAAAQGAAAPIASEAATTAAAELPDGVALFDARAAELESALATFGARLRDPVGSLDCATVAAARARVSQGFDSLSVAMHAAGGSLEVGRSMRFNKLGADVGELDREYLRTRCARTPPAD